MTWLRYRHPTGLTEDWGFAILTRFSIPAAIRGQQTKKGPKMPNPKKKRKMSAAARRKISLAQKRRWRAFRAAGGTTRNGKLGRPAKSGSLKGNPFLNMPIARFVEERRRLEEAWKGAKKMLR